MTGRWILTVAVMGIALAATACSRKDSETATPAANGVTTSPAAQPEPAVTAPPVAPVRPAQPATPHARPVEAADGSGVSENATEVAPVEEEVATPSLFRSLGRALGKGVSDAITNDAAEEPSQP